MTLTSRSATRPSCFLSGRRAAPRCATRTPYLPRACEGDTYPTDVKHVSVEGDVLECRCQYPLRLGYGIPIHPALPLHWSSAIPTP